MLVVHRFAEQQQIALLSREEEDEAHHHGEGRLVEGSFVHALEEFASIIFIDTVEGLHEHLNRLTHLVAELVGDLLLVRAALGEHGFERISVGNAIEAINAEERTERS